ncbi:hypothetical protein [Paenibacillus sp. FSL L8-0638]|uniref:hypothetical protein n=1 Tax=Paenibacillus TaxID=44249 RepID=UPI0031594EFA
MLVLYPNGTQSYIDVTQISQAQGPYPSMPSIPGQSGVRVGAKAVDHSGLPVDLVAPIGKIEKTNIQPLL